ncbi:unnamed protein product [Paramecium octaurelia]|uniref:Uncharacterized protein n=1 Tax=Paramecium octaurelia TaxID=43137 RepID=A0A8S1W6M8_PAROT|nr:unnamed protein product [Paramecium octaurelia]
MAQRIRPKQLKQRKMDANLEWGSNFRWWIQQILGKTVYYKTGLNMATYQELHEVNMDQELKNSIAPACEIGEYLIIKKQELLVIQFSGGGSQNEQDQKSWKQIELGGGFLDESTIIYNGEYENGKIVGRWDIEFRSNDSFFIMENFLLHCNPVTVAVDLMIKQVMNLRQVIG